MSAIGYSFEDEQFAPPACGVKPRPQERFKGVQKYFKNLLTQKIGFEIVRPHTETTTQAIMRTKTLLLTAALSAAGVATSMAQVYSVNAVGYINLTMKPGFNLVANQLNGSPGNGLNTILPAAPLESQVLKFSNNNYTSDISDGAEWLNAETGEPSATTVSPGEGFFFFNPGATDLAVTLVGEVPQGGSLTVALNPGFTLASSIVPQQVALTAANGFPQILEAQYLTFNAMTQNYDVALINDGNEWLNSETGEPAAAVPNVGQGFFVFNPGATVVNWTRSFSVNN